MCDTCHLMIWFVEGSLFLMKKFLILFLVSVLGFGLFGCSDLVEEGPYVEAPTVGKKIPQFDGLIGSDGEVHSLSEFEGQPLLLMFETTECSYCEKERPSIHKLLSEYEGRLNIVTIAISESIEDILKYVENEGIEYLWLAEGDQFVSVTYLAVGTPDHLFVDSDGILVSRIKGYLEYDILVENIENLLK